MSSLKFILPIVAAAGILYLPQHENSISIVNGPVLSAAEQSSNGSNGNKRAIQVKSLDDLAKLVSDKSIQDSQLEKMHTETLKVYNDFSPESLERHLTGKPESLSIDDVMYLIAFQKVHMKRFVDFKKDILKANPKDYVTMLKYWQRVLEVESSKGYRPNMINAGSNLGFIWGGLERRFGKTPERSVQYLEAALASAEDLKDAEWVSRREFHYQQNPKTVSPDHRKKSGVPERIPYPREAVFSGIYAELGRLLTAKLKTDEKTRQEMFEKGINAYIKGVLNTGSQECAEYLLGYRNTSHRGQVLTELKRGLNSPDRSKRGHNLLNQVIGKY